MKMNDNKPFVVIPFADVTIGMLYCHTNTGIKLSTQEPINMKKIVIPIALVVTLLFTTGCGLIGSLIGGGGRSSVGSLWPDVPPMEGATPNKDLQLPTFARLAVQAIAQGNLEFIAYVTTKSPQEVADFYTAERMQALGWSSDTGGCQVGNDANAGGGFCAFAKKEDNKETALIIATAKDEKSGETQIFYIRAQGTATPAP
jgi:hypothetical protein